MTDERGTKAGLTERAHHAGDGKPAAPRQRRMSAKRKQEAVLRILRGEDLELVSREIGTTAADLSAWRDRFLEAGAVSLKSRPDDDRDRELKAMREKIGEMTMANELLEAKIDRLEAGTPFRLRRSKR
jgi:transposase-like protein